MSGATARVHKLAKQNARDAEAEERLMREMRGPYLQELVRAHGGYDKITAEAWAAYNRELALWRSRVAVGDFHQPPYRKLRQRR
jgi:hypothetical protein